MYASSDQSSSAHIRVIGQGVVDAPTDLCIVRVTLNVMKATVDEALSSVAELAKQATNALRGVGVASEDIRTRSIALNDFFDREKQQVTARVASYGLEVIIQNLDDVGGVFAELATAAGDALQVKDFQLALKDPGPHRSVARKLAVEDARAKAQELAEAAGLTLGPVQSIWEGGLDRMGPRLAAARIAAAAPEMPVEPGVTTVMSEVTVVFAIS